MTLGVQQWGWARHSQWRCPCPAALAAPGAGQGGHEASWARYQCPSVQSQGQLSLSSIGRYFRLVDVLIKELGVLAALETVSSVEILGTVPWGDLFQVHPPGTAISL